MNNRVVPQLAVAVAAALAFAAVACSSAPPPDSSLGDNDSKTKVPASPSKAPAGNNPSNPPPSDPTKPLQDNGACGTAADAKACFDCCVMKGPDAFDAASKAADDCICQAGAAGCATECAASFCAAADNNNQPTAACTTCLEAKGPACSQKFTDSCNANAGCKAVEACIAGTCEPKFPSKP